MKIHSETKKKECQICGKEVKHLAHHMKAHNQLQPFKCDICERSFIHLATLSKHIRTHTEDKPRYKFSKNTVEM